VSRDEIQLSSDITLAAPAEVDIDRRFGGLARLYGPEGARRIRQASVMVVGIGGVGSWTAEALARSGVGSLVLVDMDHVSESNVNRQIHALSSTLGMEKVTAMQERIQNINPECEVRAIDEFVDAQNWSGLIDPSISAVVDACDQMAAKFEMARWARHRDHRSTHFICVGAAGGKLHAHQVDIDDLARTTHDPLLAQLRARLRRHAGAPREGKRIGIPCVFSREAVATPNSSSFRQDDGSLNCHGYGSTVAVTATFGMVAAGWVLERLAAPVTRDQKAGPSVRL
jgi:tRNA A37 threonylcarbamoyladenosine dehydratase